VSNSRSRSQKIRHQRERDPLSVCWRCSKLAVTTEVGPSARKLKLSEDERKKFHVGVCYQHSKEGYVASAKRAAIARAAPKLYDSLRRLTECLEQGKTPKEELTLARLTLFEAENY
jgi:hypothetical protein